MSKRRCRTCPGRDGCIHVSIYDQKMKVCDEEVKMNEEVTEETINLSPRIERIENCFKQQFQYPPTDTESYNRINNVKSLFPCGRMIPAGHQIDKCECGHVFSELVMESNRPVIHHSKATCDSRDGSLATYMLATGNCEHVKYFSGTEVGLSR